MTSGTDMDELRQVVAALSAGAILGRIIVRIRSAAHDRGLAIHGRSDADNHPETPNFR